MRRNIAYGFFCSVVSLLSAVSLHAQADVLTQHNDNNRTGSNVRETVLEPSNVNRSHFGMLFKRSLDDQSYTQPLVVGGVHVLGGTHDLVYVTTANNSVYAFDANDASASKSVWHVNFGSPADVHSSTFGCLDINGEMGIIGTPVIDKTIGALYVVALTRTGTDRGPGRGFIQRIHALDLSTGADLPGSPVEVKAPDFEPLMQNQRPALLLANDTLYVGYASHCDRQPYHGFLLAYDSRTLMQVAVLNTSPTGSGASIWQSGQGPAADANGNVYVVSGNGSWDGVHNFSESFLKLSPKLSLLDWFTPTNHFDLDKRDDDLNSSGATLIPGTNLVLGGGKEGVLYTLDTQSLGHLGDENARQHFKATASHLHSLVYWESVRSGRLLYVWGQRDKAKVYNLDQSRVDETPRVVRDTLNEGHPGAMLSLSANGDRNGILWASIHATGDSWHESRPGVLHAYDADDIRRELWNSLEVPERDDCGKYSKMAPPTISNGKVFLASFGHENVGTGQVCIYGLLPRSGTAALLAPAEVVSGIDRGIVKLSWQDVRNAAFYQVMRFSTFEPKARLVATGLTSASFEEAAPNRGEVFSYVVYAVNSNGTSTGSKVATTIRLNALPREQ